MSFLKFTAIILQSRNKSLLVAPPVLFGEELQKDREAKRQDRKLGGESRCLEKKTPDLLFVFLVPQQTMEKWRFLALTWVK